MLNTASLLGSIEMDLPQQSPGLQLMGLKHIQSHFRTEEASRMNRMARA
jgi:hypothetical protein